jgi:sugar phosphate isomerase/epimerase
MKISCTPISMSKTFREEGMELEGYINYCAELGTNGTDLLDTRGYPWQWKDAAKEFKSVHSWLNKAGVKLAAFACGNDFTKKSDDDFQKQVDNVKNAINEAAELGAPLLRIFGGKNPCAGGELPLHKAMERVLQGIEMCLPEAEKRNVVLGLENHGCMPGHSYEVEKIIRRFRSKHLKCTFDCANFLANNMDETEDPVEAYRRLSPFIAHVHFKDFKIAAVPPRRVDACLTGQGLVPLRQLANLMEDDSYTGFCSLEYEAVAAVPETEGVPRCIAYMNEIKKLHSILK